MSKTKRQKSAPVKPAAASDETSAASAASNVKPAKGKKTKRAPEPLESEALSDAPLLETASAPPDDAPLGTLSASAGTDSGAALETPPAPKHETLRLPKGAFLVFRKSGGLHFSTREVVIYPDGRVAYDARGVPQKDYNRLRRALNDGQMLSLRKLLDQTNFWRAETTGEQNPDAFAYEIVARLGQRANEIQVFDGSTPEPLKPLIERLTPLLPHE